MLIRASPSFDAINISVLLLVLPWTARHTLLLTNIIILKQIVNEFTGISTLKIKFCQTGIVFFFLVKVDHIDSISILIQLDILVLLALFLLCWTFGSANWQGELPIYIVCKVVGSFDLHIMGMLSVFILEFICNFSIFIQINDRLVLSEQINRYLRLLLFICFRTISYEVDFFLLGQNLILFLFCFIFVVLNCFVDDDFFDSSSLIAKWR